MSKFFNIIIPAYNCGEGIYNLFDSIESQEFKDFKVIVVDDGSKDNTYEIIKNYSNKYSFDLEVLTQRNSGPGAARKYGLSVANSRYVLFFDSDDYVAKDTLKTLYGYLNEESIDILEFGYEKVDEDNHSIKERKLVSEPLMTECLAHYIRQINTTNYLCNKVFSYNIIKTDDFKDLYYSEDACALAFAFSRAKSYKVISDILYYYVISPNSACGIKFTYKRLDTLKADQIVLEMLKNKAPILISEMACNSCLHITKLYSGFKKSGTLDENIKRLLINSFKENYVKIKPNKLKIILERSHNQALAILLFRYCRRFFEILIG